MAQPGPRTVMVIGGAGFVGSHLVDRLLGETSPSAAPMTVDVVDDLSTGALAHLSEARAVAGAGSGVLRFHHLDASSAEVASLIAMRAPEVIYLCVSVPYHDAPVEQMLRPMEVLARVLEAARRAGVPRVVAVVPASVIYGVPSARSVPVKEAEITPRGWRGVMARTMVDLLEVYRDAHAIEFAVLALGSVYGPRQRHGVVAALRAARAAGTAPVLHGDGRATRDFVFVDDAVDALMRAGTRGSGLVINVGTGVQTSLEELWELIGEGAPATRDPSRASGLSRFALSPMRARIHLGWAPWTTLAEGLALSASQ